ncbi:cyclic peptide export ABC transporter [Thiothrix lacustris]|uniref:cyclic peptide export ABC transporter n=1 Tax=Thiothrix lacustris TaxID=525917 RepID=UPI0027E4AE31|nr:cyclic peptide export ABC transporter [Thiothrix lacustris]WMP19410.1 cyclic peptide export ABC transporter [Thiothrix lacustris]
MKLLNFMTQETDVSKQRILALAAVSGIANSLLLVIINEAATGLKEGVFETHLFAQYVLTFILFIFAQRASQREAVTAVEWALQRVRVRIANKVRLCELRTVEELGDIGSYSPLTQGANTIAQSAMYLVTGIESLLVLVFASLYLLWLSPPSFLVAIVLIGFAIAMLVRHYQKTFKELSEASQKEGQFFERFTSILKGFKQLKTNRRESDDLFWHIQQLAGETSDLKSRSNVRLLEDILLSNVTFYLLLLLVVFLLPSLVTAPEENLFQVIATILFMMEPVSMISAALPNVSKTNVAINGLYRLEGQLDKALPQQYDDTATRTHLPEDFTAIHLHAASFTYTNAQRQPLFQAGPLTMSCQRGETIFITGGNGSGKSTFLKLFTGLYQPEQGCIRLDEKQLEAGDYPAYRELFAVVFDDFHLFDRLYGLLDVPDTEINDWLEKLGISHKTRFEQGRFTNTDLSTGQRKRLAFIAAIIQHRPILVFDELAADQEPAFRKRFYEEILPELKAQGKTIIAVTHDDRYFSIADRVLHMEAGKLEETRL